MQAREWERIHKCLQVLKLYTEPRPKPYELREIDEILGFSKGQASKLLKRGRELGLATYRETLPLPRDKDLGRELARKYAPCEFLVVETQHPVVRSAATARSGRRGASGQDDVLHGQLGMVAAQHLSRKLAKIRALGVGAGRALFHAGRELFHYPQAREHGHRISVLGLHGHVDRRIWRDSTLFPREATDIIQVVDAFSASLPGSRPIRIHEPLIQHSMETAREKIPDHARFIAEAEWMEGKAPGLALVGMGVMGGLPAMNQEQPLDRRMQARRREMMRPVRRAWEEIRALCRSFYEEKGFIPVSDVCDRLFWVPEVCETGPRSYMKARRLIREINGHILGVQTGLPDEPLGARASRTRPRFASLDRVERIVVVAGGELKMRGLARLLDHRRDGQGRRFMDLLIVDLQTARLLLEFKKPV